MSSEHETYSIMLHVRRVIYEDAYVAVPVTDRIIIVQEDGTGRIDSEAFIAEALRISENPGVEWQRESITTQPHPVQQPLPEGRTSFDAIYAESDSADD